ncbi:SAM-dependent methyltransferase [Sphingomonas sp.]|uniref:SAM-dependent methyltransferase n=1 Tax=Sphingomonas sp. TaxID=28214 RepID=UPI00286D8904|nr:SAM-dependent methyltransferase [Sphingomonas sp.]
MAAPLFDPVLRAMRRDRAARAGVELFVLERAFADICDRLAPIRRRFRSALLIGCPDPAWPARLKELADHVDVLDPGPAFARAAGGELADEEQLALTPGAYDLCVTVGCLDTVNDLPAALLRLALGLGADSLLIGAMAGGDTLPRLRAAMRAADAVTGAAAPHVHPRIEPGALAGLLSAAGFAMPVVDVDRIPVSYRSLDALVADLRRMAATNLLAARPRNPLSRPALAAARKEFAADQPERFELLHFAAWTPPAAGHG